MSASGYGHLDVLNGGSDFVTLTNWKFGFSPLLSMVGPRLSPTELQSELT